MIIRRRRRTAELSELLDWNIEEAIQNLKNEYSPEILNELAITFIKESKSSSKIEKEEPSQIEWKSS